MVAALLATDLYDLYLVDIKGVFQGKLNPLYSEYKRITCL